MCGGDGGGGGESMCVCVRVCGGASRFKALYVQGVDTVTPVQYMQFNLKTPQAPQKSPPC